MYVFWRKVSKKYSYVHGEMNSRQISGNACYQPVQNIPVLNPKNLKIETQFHPPFYTGMKPKRTLIESALEERTEQNI